MNKTITLNLTFRNYKKVKDSTQNHHLILLLLPHKKQARTTLQIPPFHWDKEKQAVKPRFRNQHKNLIKEINLLKDRCTKYPRLILEEEIHPDNVIDEILGRNIVIDNETTVIDFIQHNSAPFKNSLRKHIDRMRGVHKHLEKYKPNFGGLTLSKLNDNRNIDSIAEALSKAKLMKTTISGYMQTLDRVTDLAGLKNKRPFKARKLYPSNAVSKVQYKIELENMVAGLQKIKTYKDIEAYLMFLYSYCLQGLDAVDIANIDESAIHNYRGDKRITHYYPFGDYIMSEGEINLKTKYHIRGEIVRSKSAGSIDTMINLFPTLFIRDWLVYLMNITSPHIAYRGKDRLRIFKHKTLTKEGKKLQENHRDIKIYMGTLSRKMQYLFGGSMRNSRHTITQLGKMYLGLDKAQMKMQLNHKLGGAIDNYAQGENALELRDVRHHQLLKYMCVEQLVRGLYMRVKTLFEGGELQIERKTKAKPKKHPSPIGVGGNDVLIGWTILEHSVSSKWSFELEKEWNMIKLQNSVPQITENENGEMVMAVPNEDDLPERFHQLNKIRKEAFGEFNIMISKGGGIARTPKNLAEALQEDKNYQKVNEIIKN